MSKRGYSETGKPPLDVEIGVVPAEQTFYAGQLRGGGGPRLVEALVPAPVVEFVEKKSVEGDEKIMEKVIKKLSKSSCDQEKE